MLIKWLRSWAPFKIDALGLVTLMGAEEVNRSVGRLSKSHITEYLPVVASFVFANDSFRSGIPGMEMYNISDGIFATDLAGWFSRWLLMQKVTYNCTTLSINVRTPYAQQNKTPVLAISLGLAASLSVIILACLTSDWWGLANAISLGISVLVRSAMLEALRRSVDRSASSAVLQSGTVVKILCKLTTGSVVTIYAPRGVVTQCLLTDPRSSNRKVYFISRSVGWLAFFIHSATLSMASLPSQLLTVFILAVSTISIVFKVGSQDDVIGQKLVIRRVDHRGPDTSMAACYARLHLSNEEEEAMITWKLMPQLRNEIWWRKYRDCLACDSTDAFKNWSQKETWMRYSDISSQGPNGRRTC